MAQSSSYVANQPMVFTVRRREAELVAPAKPTPCAHLPLSDIDDQPAFHLLIPAINFYSDSDGDNDSGITMSCRDPVKVIREALAEALVFYYPLAGRLREGPGRKLFVDCTGELGVLFVEADADVTLEQFGVPLQPHFPFLEELLHDVPGSHNIVGCPLLLVQVTRLLCGGFVVAYRYNHVVCDGWGILQFLTMVGELARGLPPSMHPVWERNLLNARVPPRVTCTHQEYDEVIGAPLDNIVHRSFFLGVGELWSLRQMVPPEHRANCTSFELIIACIWRCRTFSLGYEPHEDVRVAFTVDARDKYKPRLPKGYYGNAASIPTASTTSGNLCTLPIGYALKLVKDAKEKVTEEYMRSTSDLMVLRGRPHISGTRTFFISDTKRLRFRDLNFGWGKACFGGIAKCGLGAMPGFINFCIAGKNAKKEDGTLVLLNLPESAMKIFEEELKRMLNHAHQSAPPILSPL